MKIFHVKKNVCLQTKRHAVIDPSLKKRAVDILLCLIDDNNGAVDGTVCVVAPLDFLIILPVQFIASTLFWSRPIVYSSEDKTVEP